MREIFVISDTHFGHENILKFSKEHGDPTRSFSSVEEMDELMIERWNSVVRAQDKVYHLGDFALGPGKQKIGDYVKRLNGHIRLIVGNHDRIAELSKYIKKISLWRQFPEYGLLFTHVPVHPSTLEENRFSKKPINVHGHIHQNKSPDGPYKCVCVEQTNYTPVNIEELIQ